MSAFLPISFRLAALNSLPMSNAINPSAMLESMLTRDNSSADEKPNVLNFPKTYGPTSIPAIKNAVTSGNIIPFLPIVCLNIRVIIRPAESENAVLKSNDK